MNKYNHRHDNRKKRQFDSAEDALQEIRRELEKINFRTTRTFWVGKNKYIARKTNKLPGYVNLTITPPLRTRAHRNSKRRRLGE